jgi:hypothetical protein
MDKNEFDTQLQADGYRKLRRRRWRRGQPTKDMVRVRGLMLAGAFTVIQEASQRRIARGGIHSRETSIRRGRHEGAQILVGQY